MPQMKALSLWQPWATLIAIGAKRYETRSWLTSYRGLLAIHAAKRPIVGTELNPAIRAVLDHHGTPPNDLPLGAVLCVVRLVEVVPSEQVIARAQSDKRVRLEELNYGNYAPGRYAWKMEIVKVAPEPIPAKGAQGLWTWEY